MNTIFRLCAALLLLIAPAFGAVQTGAAADAAIAKLQGTHAAMETASTALAASPEDAALKTAQEAASTEYSAALEAARELRDAAKDGKGGKFGTELWKISGDDLEDGTLENTAGKGLDYLKKAKNWAIEEGPGMVLKAVLFLLILIVFKFIGNVAASMATRAMKTAKLNISDLLREFFQGSIKKVFLVVGLMIALEMVGVKTGPLLAGIGVIGFVVGFALQDTLSNFAAGVMILMYRPYDIGDVITAAGETGKVQDMSLVSTILGTPDNQRLIIPNGSIWGGTIRNVTAQATRRVDMVVGVSYSDDLDRAQELLMEIAKAHPLVLADPEPVVMVNNLGDSAVEFIVRPWSKTGDYWAVYWDLTKTIKQRLDQEGISFPFPQSDVHIVHMPDGK